MTISGRPVEIYALLGGQWPHSSYMVPGGVMCAPTLTDVTRAWSILEHFRRNWMEPIWLGCSLERYEEIKSYDDFMAWLDERPEHANSDLGLYWRMSKDIGARQVRPRPRPYVSWGYLPHEDKYSKPTIDGRNAALIMKSGVYDGEDGHPQAHGPELHPRGHASTPGTTSRAASIPSTARPCRSRKNTVDMDGKYSWATAVRHEENGRLEAGPLARQLVAGGKHGEAWQHYDPLVLDMYKKMGGASVLLRHFARMHEGVKLYRQAERGLREFRSTTPGTSSRPEKDGRGWGATEAIRGALCHWIEVQGGKIKNYQIIAPTTWNVGPRSADGDARADGGIADRHADRRSARSCRGRACLPLVRLMPGMHGSRP